MEPLDLDPDGYAGTYKLVGGRPALDFVNTVSWAGQSRQHDWLSNPRNLDMWCDAVGLPTGPNATTADLRAAIDLRRALTETLRPLGIGEPPSADHLARLSELVAETARHRTIDPGTLTWTWMSPSSATDRLHGVIHDAGLIITEADHTRVRQCPACDWLFEDTSRNGRRRWCDMADCGSRSKSKSYYERSKT